MFKRTGSVEDSGNIEIANRRKIFVHSGSRMDRTDTGGNIPDMFLRTERGIHCENQRRRMSFFDAGKRRFQIEGVNRCIQRSVDMNIFPAIPGKLLTDQRSQTVPCDPITSDAQNDDLLPGTIDLTDTFFQHMSQFIAGGAFLLSDIIRNFSAHSDHASFLCDNIKYLPILYPERRKNMPDGFPNKKEPAENVVKNPVFSCTKRQNPHRKRRILGSKRGEEYDRSHL